MTDDFIPARTFDLLVASARRVEVAGHWFPNFATESEARSFANYVGGFPRRVAPRTVTVSKPRPSASHGGYVADLLVRFPHWGDEEGRILCRGGQVAGLAIENGNGRVILPLKRFVATMRTRSRTLYVLYADGSGFCRSASDGAMEPAKTLLFGDEAVAVEVMKKGGSLRVTAVPAPGLVPLYFFNGARPDSAGWLTVGPKDYWRCGTRLEDIEPA